MTSKRYKKLPEKTKELKAELIEKVIPDIKKKLHHKIWWVNRSKYSDK